MNHASRRALPLLAAAALLVAGCSEPADRVDDALAQRRAGHPREALQLLGAVLADLGDGRLPPDLAGARLTALAQAADISYLELGDYDAAIAYYRRVVAQAPASDAAVRARIAIGDIYRDRLGDRVAAIAQYAAVAASQSAKAPRYQLEVARQYLALGDFAQARSEARDVWVRWPADPHVAEARLVAARGAAASGHATEALDDYEALARSGPSPISALAAEEAAAIHAEQGHLDRAVALYEAALPSHPNPAALRIHLAALERRRAATATSRPGDRAAALDHQTPPHPRNR